MQIIQLLMADTIEEATQHALQETRMQAAGSGDSDSSVVDTATGTAASGSSSGDVRGNKSAGKRPRGPDADADEGRQAALLNSLKLLRSDRD